MADATGYDPSPDDDTPQSPFQSWSLEEHTTAYTDDVYAKLIVDGEQRGLLRFDNEQELKWLKEQIPQERRRPLSE